jgi:hypothetical protein
MKPWFQIVAPLVLFGGVASVALMGRGADTPREPEKASTTIVGVKIYQAKGDLDHLFASFDSLGINTLFISEELAADTRFRDLARRHHMPVFVIFPVFYDPEALKQDPGLYAITRTGERAQEDWVQFVCPTRDKFRHRKIEAMKRLVVTLQPDGVSLDFIRFFVYWEMIHPDRSYASITNTCFCPSCLASFSAATGITIPASVKTPQQAAAWIEANHLERWAKWKCGVITSMVEDLVCAAKIVRPGLKVNLHAVPWRGSDYGGAIRKVAGQDFAAISQFTDYLSPMCYTLMLRRPPKWVASVVKDMSAVASCPILASIQVRGEYESDLAMSTRDFEATLDAALAPPSRGVIFWSWDHLAKEPEKMAVIAHRFAPHPAPARGGP